MKSENDQRRQVKQKRLNFVECSLEAQKQTVKMAVPYVALGLYDQNLVPDKNHIWFHGRLEDRVLSGHIVVSH